MRLAAHHLFIDDRVGFVQESESADPDARTLLLLHSAGQSGVQWRGTLGPLTELGYRVLVPDLPGHGHSEPATAGPTRDLGEYAEWLVKVLESLRVNRPIIVGCSIGGKIAQEMAVKNGADLAAVVSMCAEPGPGRMNMRSLKRELEDSGAPARTDRTHLGTRAVIGRRVSPGRAALIARMHCREDPIVTTNDLIGWGTHDLRAVLANAACPVTFVAGEDDLWVNADAVQRAARAVPDGRFELLHGYGHYPMEEMDDFAALLHRWIVDMLDRSAA